MGPTPNAGRVRDDSAAGSPAASLNAWRHLPNALTLLRLLAALPIAALAAVGEARLALWLFAAAGISDALDGWLAKRNGWQSRLGGLLDPIADKTLVLALCAALAWHGDLPWWLLLLVLLRDAVIVSGAVCFHLRYAPLEAAPSVLGKLTTLGLVLLLSALLAHNAYPQLMPASHPAVFFLVAGLLLASGTDYVLTWSAKARQIARQRQEIPQ